LSHKKRKHRPSYDGEEIDENNSFEFKENFEKNDEKNF